MNPPWADRLRLEVLVSRAAKDRLTAVAKALGMTRSEVVDMLLLGGPVEELLERVVSAAEIERLAEEGWKGTTSGR